MTRAELPAGRTTLGLGEPPCYVLVDRPARAGYRNGPATAKLGEAYQLVHVISPAIGGEVRGYWWFRGALVLRRPASPVEWPEMDAEVKKALGVEVRAAERGQ